MSRLLLQGGKFGHGFACSGVTQAFSGQIDRLDINTAQSAQRVIAGAVVGGTTSVISGGKFGNGAVTGAFSRALNDELHEKVKAEAQKSFASYFGERVMNGQVRDDIFNALGAYGKIAAGEITIAGGWLLKNFNPTVGGYMMLDGASIYAGGVVGDLSNAIYGTSVDGDFLGGLYRNAAETYGFSPGTGDMARAGVSLLTLGGAWTTHIPRTVSGSGWAYSQTVPAVTSASIVELANDAWTARDAFQTIAPR